MADAGGRNRNAHFAGTGRIHLHRFDREPALAVGDRSWTEDDAGFHSARSYNTGFFGVSITAPTSAPGHQRAQSARCMSLLGAFSFMSRSM